MTSQVLDALEHRRRRTYSGAFTVECTRSAADAPTEKMTGHRFTEWVTEFRVRCRQMVPDEPGAVAHYKTECRKQLRNLLYGDTRAAMHAVRRVVYEMEYQNGGPLLELREALDAVAATME